jgi:hypothetical protein
MYYENIHVHIQNCNNYYKQLKFKEKKKEIIKNQANYF